MTISTTRIFEPDSRNGHESGESTPRAALPVWLAKDFPFKGYTEPPVEGYAQSNSSTAIVIDNGEVHSKPLRSMDANGNYIGSSLVRSGWAFDKAPRVSIPANVARYRDRKLNRACMYVGYDAYADATTRGQIRHAFEPGSSIVSNWDVMEGVLDYIFLHMGIDGSEGGIGRPVVMTEPVANLTYSRKSKQPPEVLGLWID
jgi:actin-related protein 5